MNVLREIERIARSLSIIYNNRLAGTDLNRGQYVYLAYVNENPGQSQLDMVADLSIDKTTVTKALQKLASNGLIFRQRDAEDGRISRVYPTEKGRSIYQLFLEEEQEMTEILLRTMNERERYDCENLIKTMSRSLEGEWKSSRGYLSVAQIVKTDFNHLRNFESRLEYRVDDDYFVCSYRERQVGYAHFSLHGISTHHEGRWDMEIPALYLVDLFVQENYRGRGFGRQLLEMMDSLAEKMALESLRIMVEETNIPMLKMANRLLFRFVGEVTEGEKTWFCFEKKHAS